MLVSMLSARRRCRAGELAAMLLPAAAPGVLPRRAAGRVRWGLPEAEMRALIGLRRSGAG